MKKLIAMTVILMLLMGCDTRIEPSTIEGLSFLCDRNGGLNNAYLTQGSLVGGVSVEATCEDGYRVSTYIAYDYHDLKGTEK